MNRRFRFIALVSLILPASAAVCLAVAPPPPATQAIEFYDDGRYAEARALLEALDGEGRMTGPLLYRLHYCQSRDGETARSQSTLERALEKLEYEHASAASLESAFYLVNTYASLSRAEDARRVAAEAIAKLESAAWPAPKDGMPAFQAGRLYQILGRVDDAAVRFEAALRSFASTPGRFAGPTVFASRFLGGRSRARGAWTEAERYLAAVAAAPGATAADWRELATARGRAGKWAAAAEAWRQAVRLDPAEADDPRYASHLADAAAAIGALPAAAPSGTPWNQLSRAELEQLMKEQADAAGAARAAAATAPEAERPTLRATLARTRSIFVAAALEYAMRGMPIRETAFGNGYAVLIFQDSAWELPPAAAPAQN